MKRNKDKKTKIFNTLKNHISNNKKEYILLTLIFIIGIFLGVLFINNSKNEQITEITSYLNNYIDTMKNSENIETTQMLKVSLMQNVGIGIALWFFGTTVIRYSNCFWNDFI